MLNVDSTISPEPETLNCCRVLYSNGCALTLHYLVPHNTQDNKHPPNYPTP